MSLATFSRGFGVHHNGGPLGLLSCDGRRCLEVWERIRSYHTRPKREGGKGWSAIAYSFGRCPGCGRTLVGRGWGVRTAANGTKRANDEWHAILVLMGTGEPLTPRAMTGVLDLAAEHKARYGRVMLVPHSAFKATACPGHPLRTWLAVGAPDPRSKPPASPAPDPDEEDDMAIDVVEVGSEVWLIDHPFRVAVYDSDRDYYRNLARSGSNRQYAGPYQWDRRRLERHPLRA